MYHAHQKLLTNQIKTGDLVTVNVAAHLAVYFWDIRGIPIYHDILQKQLFSSAFILPKSHINGAIEQPSVMPH